MGKNTWPTHEIGNFAAYGAWVEIVGDECTGGACGVGPAVGMHEPSCALNPFPIAKCADYENAMVLADLLNAARNEIETLQLRIKEVLDISRHDAVEADDGMLYSMGIEAGWNAFRATVHDMLDGNVSNDA